MASVVYRDDSVHLMFAQRKHSVPADAGGAAVLRSLLIVSMSTQGALMFLRSCKDFTPELRKYARERSFTKELTEFSEEPGQTVALAANMILVAYSGREACMDMYMASPFVLSQLSKNGKFAVRQVVRIILSSGLLLAILEKLAYLKDRFPEDEIEVFEKASEAAKK